jgi:hypothetical protein
MKVYNGRYLGEGTTADDAEVKVYGELSIYNLDDATSVYNHSPTGMSWGYCGSGPAQLALAILVDHKDKESALPIYHQFMREIVSRFQSTWSITGMEIQSWINKELKV